MPRRQEPMKDAISCEKLWGAASRLRSIDIRMRELSRSNVLLSERKATRRTETSKYPEEKKSNEIPPVAASEQGRAQTVKLRFCGVEDRHNLEVL